MSKSTTKKLKNTEKNTSRSTSNGVKLLIVTQVMDKNHPILGFFHRWVEEFAKHFEEVHVICLEKGEYNLPCHVHVYSLGKEEKRSPSFVYAWRLWRYSWMFRHSYDSVLCHMNPEYVIVGAPLWKLIGKKISMWYAHGAISARLRVATVLSETVFTSTENGFKSKSRKKNIIGQGIDVESFVPASGVYSFTSPALVTVGRITRSKNLETLVNAVNALKQREIKVYLTIIGSAVTQEEKEYLLKIQDLVVLKKMTDQISFLGSVSNAQLPQILQRYNIFVSDGRTGSLDKALLEAMATGLMVISSNDSYSIMAPYKELTVFSESDYIDLAQKILDYTKLDIRHRAKICESLRDEVVNNHSIESFVGKIAKKSNE